ncbi:methyl-accepting chemotaxis protein (MCP) signaling protein [Krasilnikovia cinnamomea]|uniref:Methyl-accepting chemotaxis protein (MCP) signaling protein n=1 Tax=Krasilnikovia cinnamomea TaxID=349313 RepID=A0A4Q7ZRM7_9ACTN|nr:methyl-accepting chemotaxis protein [Krasilnikovia cinnamomea]RZU53145.1 methyl-accepting chemotaxis protein (MCP) signaling protein [Krasilnikovia cinnamomea]
MRKWWRSVSGAKAHPLAQFGDSLYEAFDNAPASLVITDHSGQILYRNKAAGRAVALLLERSGPRAVEELQTILKRVVPKIDSVPYVNPAEPGALVQGTAIYDRFAGGFLVTYTDTTEQARAQALAKELAQELSTASTSLAEAGQELVGNARRSSEQAEGVSQGSAELTESIKEISRGVNSASTSTTAAVQAARDATRRMGQLQESSQRIGSVTKLITEIAEQTNLLALNATIEAARAGELGKGFAVVAGEVKDLAARTAEATGQISEIIEGIQAESTEAAEGISGIVELIDAVAEQQGMIAGAVEEQSATSSEMTGGMQAVADAVQSSAEAAETVLAAAASLKDQATRLITLTATQDN